VVGGATRLLQRLHEDPQSLIVSQLQNRVVPARVGHALAADEIRLAFERILPALLSAQRHRRESALQEWSGRCGGTVPRSEGLGRARNAIRVIVALSLRSLVPGWRCSRLGSRDPSFKRLIQGAHIEMKESSPTHEAQAKRDWRRAVKAYTEPRVLQVLALGFASGLPLLLTYSTLSAWLSTAGVRRAAIGTFALVGTPYAFKYLWAPLIDRVPPPLRLGRRRGWGITIQILLIGAVLALGLCNPNRNLPEMAMLAVVVAFLSASQDIVIDAWRVESLSGDQQAPGAAMIQSGYRIGMLVAGAGGLMIAAYAGWFAAYATMAALLSLGVVVFLLSPEPAVRPDPYRARSVWDTIGHAFTTAVIGPFRDFMRRPLWPVILIAVFGYKLGEAMAGVMSTPLYISLGFTLPEIAATSKLFGFFSVIAGALIGGVVTTRYGIKWSLIVCGILQCAGNLFFVLQAVGGHRIGYLALCVTAENLTGAMAGTALITYLSSLCSPAFTATQFALLSSLALVGRTVVASSGGALSEKMGWVRFFLLTSVVALPAILLFVWIGPRDEFRKTPLQSALEAAGDGSEDPVSAGKV
jgi:MFS transporter, PAT family, beta-lactamase induction signal transducer AmpG